jgi:hypothetical protein
MTATAHGAKIASSDPRRSRSVGRDSWDLIVGSLITASRKIAPGLSPEAILVDRAIHVHRSVTREDGDTP